ncbi:hypothetical protein [Longimicrobium sp.]|uniref:hypothetical protein n=1 Tax=Longimicrobium sp. TaxID=2029185 RepID=UPI002E311922|nr:hypothetical protein [Longimicrobium sp.]HEX6039891.1 hypothetical protein [Longimicrobium sp.]
MHKPFLATVLAASAMAASACSGDGATGPEPGGGATLSAAEVTQLNQAILAASVSARESGTPPVGAATGAMGYTFTQTAPCPAGGNVDLDGDMNIAWNTTARTASLSTDFAVKHGACGHRMDNGSVVTLTGDPDIDVSLDLSTGPGGLSSLSVRETGAFNWSRDDGNGGRCSMDVTATLNASTRVVSISGTFCGVPVTGRFQGA